MENLLYTKSDFEREGKVSQHSQEHNSDYRSEFRRDYARLIHSAAFRRLQGKTQLFPGTESDFFRNRLTHSIEVAQIAKSIAIKLNKECQFFDGNQIDLDLIEIASLAHDLGHPPFGHNGEKALNDSLKEHGGFEGNAQTLRILAKLEKKEIKENKNKFVQKYGVDKNGNDFRLGLNLTYRTLASVLKYDSEIPLKRGDSHVLSKGYYSSESNLVSNLKKNVTQKKGYEKFKTIECQIMDIADDIAYSTYDLEDAMKAGFLTPLDMISADENILESVADKVRKNIGYTKSEFNKETVLQVLYNIFSSLQKTFNLGSLEIYDDSNIIKKLEKIFINNGIRDHDSLYDKLGIKKEDIDPEKIRSLFDHAIFEIIGISYRVTINFGQSGYSRTSLTSDLINYFISGIELQHANENIPALSTIKLEEEKLKMVETLKHLVFELITMSPRLQVVKYRGYEIVKTIFDALNSGEGYFLLPDDFRSLYTFLKDNEIDKKRVICDFIAGMTDRYALEFYSRLKSENAQTIFKPI